MQVVAGSEFFGRDHRHLRCGTTEVHMPKSGRDPHELNAVVWYVSGWYLVLGVRVVEVWSQGINLNCLGFLADSHILNSFISLNCGRVFFVPMKFSLKMMSLVFGWLVTCWCFR